MPLWEAPVNLILLAILGLPWLGAVACFGLRRWAAWLAVLVCVAVIALLGLLLPAVLWAPLQVQLPGVLGLGLRLGVDYLGWGLAGLAGLIWLGVCLCSPYVLEHRRHGRRYYVFLLTTFGAVLGVFLSGDLFTLFLFFELMTLSSYVLVIHQGDARAVRAGSTYLYLSIAGGLCLLFGLFVLYAGTGHTAWEPVLEQLLARGIHPAYVAAPLVVGFGVKAGIMPLHVWMIQVYPTMSWVVCALSSGILLKTGVYGILRTTTALGGTPDSIAFTGLGAVLLALGLASMLIGAALASWQREIRSLLAYSSVSQVGYLLVGLGTAVLLGPGRGLALGATVLHLTHHALFKAGLFLAVGIMLARRVRWLAAYGYGVALVMGGGLVGLPLFNGYVSKSLLQAALTALADELPSAWTFWSGQAFLLGSALTVVYVLRLFWVILPAQEPPAVRAPGVFWPAALWVTGLAGVVLVGGSYPHWTLEAWAIPVVWEKNLPVAMLEQAKFYYSGGLSKTVGTLLAGLVLFGVGQRYWWNRPAPQRCWTEDTLERCNQALTCGVNWTGQILDGGVSWSYQQLVRWLALLMERVGLLEALLGGGFDRMGRGSRQVLERVLGVEEAIESGFERVGNESRQALERALGVEDALGRAYEGTSQAAYDLTRRAAAADGQLDESLGRMAQAALRSTERALQATGDDQRPPDQVEPANVPRFNSFNFTVAALIVALMLMGLLFAFMIYGLGGW